MANEPFFSVYSMDWLDDAACQDLDVSDYFVQAGHVIDEEVINICRGCPVRIECIKHSYNNSLNITGGYFGGLSPGQRREMSLEEAIEFSKSDKVVQSKKIVTMEGTADDDEPIVYS